MTERERSGQRSRRTAAQHAATPSASQPVDFRAGLRACEGVRHARCRGAFPCMDRTVADAAVVVAYRCGGSAGMPPARSTGFPFQPWADTPRVT